MPVGQDNAPGVPRTGFGAEINRANILAASKKAAGDLNDAIAGLQTSLDTTNRNVASLQQASTTEYGDVVTSGSTTLFAPSASSIVHSFHDLNATTGNVDVTLPKASDIVVNNQNAAIRGIVYYLVRIDGTANTVTIHAATGDTINGAATLTLSAQYESFALAPVDVGTWRVVGHYTP